MQGGGDGGGDVDSATIDRLAPLRYRLRHVDAAADDDDDDADDGRDRPMTER